MIATSYCKIVSLDRLSNARQSKLMPLEHIGRTEVGSTGNTNRMRREEAEGQTKYRSEDLCAAKALASHQQKGEGGLDQKMSIDLGSSVHVNVKSLLF
jgi:hypothetical protein